MENFPQEETMNKISEAPRFFSFYMYTVHSEKKNFSFSSMWIFPRGHEAIYKATFELKRFFCMDRNNGSKKGIKILNVGLKSLSSFMMSSKNGV